MSLNRNVCGTTLKKHECVCMPHMVIVLAHASEHMFAALRVSMQNHKQHLPSLQAFK